MKILQLDDTLRSGYCGFLREQPNALVYQSLPFQDLLCRVLGARSETVVALDGGGRIRGVLPMLACDGPWGSVYNSLPFYGSNGGIVAGDEDARRALVSWYDAIARDPGVASCTLVANPLDENDPGEVVHNRTDFRIGQLSPIDVPADGASKLMAGFHYKTRNMIRKAEKSGVKVAVANNEITFLEETHRENLTALGGIPKPASFFKLFPRHFEAGREYRIYTARIGDSVVAALLLFYFNHTVEYYMPVIKERFRELQPMSLLIYVAMCDAARDAYRWWNWGGTWPSQEGVYRFKSRWATLDRKYTYYVQLNREDIAQRDKRTILDAYPFFYVTPFGTLNL